MSKRDRAAVVQGLTDVLGDTDLLETVIQRDRNRRRSPKESRELASTPPNPIPVEEQSDKQAVRHADKLASKQADLQASSMTGKPYDNMTSTLSDKQTDRHADKLASKQADLQASGRADNEANTTSASRSKPKARRTPGDQVLIKDRLREAKDLATSPPVPITVRLPSQLNAWLDEYVHRSWPVRVRKQELVAEALRMLYARRGRPGEPLLATELLVEEEP